MGSCSSKEDIRANQHSVRSHSSEYPLEKPRISWQDPVGYRKSAISRSSERPSYYNKDGVPHYNHGRSTSVKKSVKSQCLPHSCCCDARAGLRRTDDNAPHKTSQTQTELVPWTFINTPYANSPTEGLSLMHPQQSHPDPSNTPLKTTGTTVDGERYRLEYVCNGASVEAESFVGQDQDRTAHLITRHLIRHPNSLNDPKKGELHIAILQKVPVGTIQSLDMKPLVCTANMTDGTEEGDLMLDAVHEPEDQLEPERNIYSPNFIYLGYDPKRAQPKKKFCQQKIPVVQSREQKPKFKRSLAVSAFMSEEPDRSLQRTSQVASTTATKQDTSQLILETDPEINGQPCTIRITEPSIVPVIVERNTRYISISSVEGSCWLANKTSDVDVKIPEAVEQFTNNGSCANLFNLEQPTYIEFDQNEEKTSVGLPSGSHFMMDYEMDKDAEILHNTSGAKKTLVAPSRLPGEQMSFAYKPTDNARECSVPAAVVFTTLVNEPRAVEAFEEWPGNIQVHNLAVHAAQRGGEAGTNKEVKKNSRRNFLDLLTNFKKQEPQFQMLESKTCDNESGPVASAAQENTPPLYSEKNTTDAENTEDYSEQLPDQTPPVVPENSADDAFKATSTCSASKQKNGNFLCSVDKTVHMRLEGNPLERSCGVKSMSSITTPKMAMEVMLDAQQTSPLLQSRLRCLNTVKPTNREQMVVALRSKAFVSANHQYSSDRTNYHKGSKEDVSVIERSKLDTSVPSFLPPIENVHTNTVVSAVQLLKRTSKTEQNESVTLPKLRPSGSNLGEHKTGASANRTNHIPNKSSAKTRKKEYDILVLHQSK